MKNYKKFTIIFILVIIGSLLFHIITYFKYIKVVNPTEYIVGDLARMSYHTDIISKRYNENNLSRHHIHFNDYNGTNIDMITIGDSFSNGGAGGLNRYYQDYIATNNNIKVLNIVNFPKAKNDIETIMILLNSGYLKLKKVKYIIVESVQREVIKRFGQNNINFRISTDENIQDIMNNSYDTINPKDEDKPKITMINNININALKYNIYFQIKGYGKYNRYFIEKLNQNYFSSTIANELIFLRADILNINLENKTSIQIVNDNFNKLATLLEKEKIKLYFMPVVDKYNLYSKYIVSNIYPQSIFFEELRKLPKEYNLIDTKAILGKEVKNGKKDMFYSDDTHWNYKASEVIFNIVNFE